MSIERNFDVPFIAELALREKQIQQNYRPIIAIHKWFARRPGTLFRGLILSEFGSKPLQEIFFCSNNLAGIRIADPFMGGGTPVIEANRLGCNVIGYDINPMAYWIVREATEHLNLTEYRTATDSLICQLEHDVGPFYRTRCVKCDDSQALVKYFLWVKIQKCSHCRKLIDLFPGFLVAQNRRHPKNVVVCSSCGDLNEVDDRKNVGSCVSCGSALTLRGPAKRNRCACPHCGTVNIYPASSGGPLRHRMFAIEYYCPRCKPLHKGRFFKKPDRDDLAKYDEASQRWGILEARFAPDDEIPSGDETDRLHRWGYRQYRKMFNDRQLLGLELSCQAIAKQPNTRIRNALATNLSDLLRYQNMLCRYDTMALKSLDIFSVHGFPVGLIQCESNIIGISKGRGANVGSGGWTNIVEKYAKAKAYCEHPFEIRYEGNRKIQIPVSGEWIGEIRDSAGGKEKRNIQLYCQSSTDANLPNEILDAVFTDPPYFGNVQYAELMDFCYVWLRRLVSSHEEIFAEPSTRNENELTGNTTLERGLDHFTEGLSTVFQRMASTLKPGAPLAFTYHHNKQDAYYPVAVAILDAGLTCSASLPCPAEMSGSIHINRTGSSIIDTIFVCRATGVVPRRWIAATADELAELVAHDLGQLRSANVRLTRGDIRCVIYGHLIRLAIWRLRRTWNRSRTVSERLDSVARRIEELGGLSAVEKCLGADLTGYPHNRGHSLHEERSIFGEHDEIPF